MNTTTKATHRKPEASLPPLEHATARVEELEQAVRATRAEYEAASERAYDRTRELEAVLAADRLDHAKAEEVESEKRKAEREVEHAIAKERGLEKRLRDAREIADRARAVAEARETADRVGRWNADTEKVQAWIEATVALHGELERHGRFQGEGMINRPSFDALDNDARSRRQAAAAAGVPVDVPGVERLDFPEAQIVGGGLPVSGRDLLLTMVRRMV